CGRFRPVSIRQGYEARALTSWLVFLLVQGPKECGEVAAQSDLRQRRIEAVGGFDAGVADQGFQSETGEMGVVAAGSIDDIVRAGMGQEQVDGEIAQDVERLPPRGLGG